MSPKANTSNSDYTHLQDKTKMKKKTEQLEDEFAERERKRELLLEKAEKDRERNLLIQGIREETTEVKEKEPFKNPNRRSPPPRRKYSAPTNSKSKGYYADLNDKAETALEEKVTDPQHAAMLEMIAPYRDPMIEELQNEEDLDLLYDLADEIINRKPGTQDSEEKRVQDSEKRREAAEARAREAEANQERARQNELRERYGEEDEDEYEDDLEELD